MWPQTTPSPRELERAVDPDTLLAGEDPQSDSIDDAVQWVRVYGELLSIELALLTRANVVLEGVTDDTFKEADVDQRLLRAEADRYRARLAHWTQRAKELAARSGGDARVDPGRRRREVLTDGDALTVG